MPRRSERTPDEGPQLKGGMAAAPRQSENDRPRRNAPFLGPRHARPGSTLSGTAPPIDSSSGELPEANISGGISIPVFFAAAYGERPKVDRDPGAPEPRGEPIPPYAPDDPEILRRLFGV